MNIVDHLYGKTDGSMILCVARGVCPPLNPVTHTCDVAAGMTFAQWWNRDDLLDPDGHCRFCGDKV